MTKIYADITDIYEDMLAKGFKPVLLLDKFPKVEPMPLPSRGTCACCDKPDCPRDLGSGGPYRCSDCIVF